jgi:hypothetical protein
MGCIIVGGGMDAIKVKREDVNQAQARVGILREALEWAVGFSQMDLTTLLPGEQFAKQLELYAWVTYAAQLGRGASAGVETIPADLTLTDAQHIMQEVFRAAVKHEKIPVTRGVLEELIWIGDRYYLVKDTGSQQSTAEHIRRGLGRLIDELPKGREIRGCEAPRSRATIPCGRWFIAKPTQRFCTMACRQRHNVRRLRHHATSA